MSENRQSFFNCFCQWDERVWSFLVLRLFLALRWIIAGVGKFMSDNGFSLGHWHQVSGQGMIDNFSANTVLPEILLKPYVHPLPYIEFLLGVALLLGIKTRAVLVLSAFFYVSLAFGQMLVAGHQTVANIGIHLGLCIAALLLVSHNRLALTKS